MKESGHFIHGGPVSFDGESRLDVRAPFDGEVVGAISNGSAEAVERALALSTLQLAEWASEVGFPPGVFNVVHGDGKTGARL